MLGLVGAVGLTAAALSLGLMAYALDGAPAVTAHAMTMVFTGFVVSEFVKLYVVRWVKETPTLSNPWLAGAVAASFLLQLAVLYTPLRTYFGTVPLSLADWGVLASVVLVGGPLLVLWGWLLRRRTDVTGAPSPSPRSDGAVEAGSE